MSKQISLSFAACLLAGCGSLLTSDQPPEQIYWLEPADLSATFDGPAVQSRLRVAVTVVPGLDTDRILTKGPGPTLNHYAGARWADNLPEVIESLLLRSLESTGLFSQVGGRRAGGSFEIQMRLEVREFFAVVSSTGSSPVIHVQMQGDVACGPIPSPAGARATRDAAANRLTAIVLAYQQALHEVIHELAGQLPAGCIGAT